MNKLDKFEIAGRAVVRAVAFALVMITLTIATLLTSSWLVNQDSTLTLLCVPILVIVWLFVMFTIAVKVAKHAAKTHEKFTKQENA